MESVGRGEDVNINIEARGCVENKKKARRDCNYISRKERNSDNFCEMIKLLVADENKNFDKKTVTTTDSIESIRAAVIQKEAVSKKIEKEITDEMLSKAKNNLLRKIPLLCDSMHFLCLKESKYTHYLSVAVELFSSDMKLQKKEVFVAIKFLSQVVPEFLTIQDPDEWVHETTIRINIHLPYAEFRKKLVPLITSESEKLFSIY